MHQDFSKEFAVQDEILLPKLCTNSFLCFFFSVAIALLKNCIHHFALALDWKLLELLQRYSCAEAFFGYKTRTFWDLQAGAGIFNGSDHLTYSLSGALTYSYLLNPYRRTQCNPVPGFDGFEAYLEGGVASFFSDTQLNESIPYVSKDGREPLFTLMGLAGLRFHFVTDKRIYILKVRYTPALIESRSISMAGIALGFGWR